VSTLLLLGKTAKISEKIKSKERNVLPLHWIVERTFSGLDISRKLAKDHKNLTDIHSLGGPSHR